MAPGRPPRRFFPRRLAAGIAVAVAGAFLLTGCNPNAGSAAAEDFEDHLRGTPGVESVDTSSDNTLPFVGTASATVQLEEAIDDERLQAVVDKIGAYLAEYADSATRNWDHVDVAFGDSLIDVAPTRSANAASLNVYKQARGIDGVVGVQLSPLEGDDGLSGFGLVLGDDTDPVAAFDRAAAMGREYDPGAAAWVRSRDRRFTISSGDAGGSDRPGRAAGNAAKLPDTAPPSTALAIQAAVGEVFPVTEARLTASSAVLRVERDADVGEATEVAEAVPGAAELDLTVYGGKITRDDEGRDERYDTGDFFGLDPLLAATEPVPGVVAIHASPGSGLRYEVADAAAAHRVYETLAPMRGLSAVTRLSLFRAAEDPAAAAGPGDPVFDLGGSPDQVKDALRLLDAAQATGRVEALSADDSVVELSLTSTDREALEAALPAMKESLLAATRVKLSGPPEVGRPGYGYLWFYPDETIFIGADDDERPSQGALRMAVEEIWNAA